MNTVVHTQLMSCVTQPYIVYTKCQVYSGDSAFFQHVVLSEILLFKVWWVYSDISLYFKCSFCILRKRLRAFSHVHCPFGAPLWSSDSDLSPLFKLDCLLFPCWLFLFLNTVSLYFFKIAYFFFFNLIEG